MKYPDPGFHIDGSDVAVFFVAVAVFWVLFGLWDMFQAWRRMSRIQRELDELEREIQQAGKLPEYMASFRSDDK